LDHLDISGVILIIVRVIVVFGAITIRSDWNVEFICFIDCFSSDF
jgi:hypothetical protein